MNFVESGFVDNGFFIRDSDTVGDFRFDGLGKLIFVNNGVTSITVEDMYSRWLDWVMLEDNMKWRTAMRVSGYDPIPGGYTGATFFVSNGWRVIYDANTVAVAGVLYSENFDTAFWTADYSPVYPAKVAALVNSSVSYQNVITATAEQIAAALIAAAQANPIHADTRKLNGAEVKGVGTSGNKWRGNV